MFSNNEIPSRYLESPVFKEVADSIGVEVDQLFELILDVKRQFFVSTATWGLGYWEKQYNITPKPNSTIEQRRSTILSAILGLNTFTKEQAQALTLAYSSLKTATFNELPEFSFITRYSVDDTFIMRELVEAFSRLKPAHLVHIIGLIAEVADVTEIAVDSLINLLAEIADNNSLDMYNNISIATSILGAGAYNPPTFEALYLNGAFKLDGSQKLNGINSMGEALYMSGYDTLHITMVKDGITVIDVI